MVVTVLSVVAYGTAVAANLARSPVTDPENPNPSPSPTPQFTLTVHLAGGGHGSVTSSPAGISCGSSCHEGFASNVAVTLTAHPSDGSTFGGWSGACSGHDACKVAMTTTRSVTATFGDKTEHLSVDRTGHGSVTSGPSGIHCPGDCGQTYVYGASVHLYHHRSHGWHFASWKGGCTGRGACVVKMHGAKAVHAVFARNHLH